MLAVFLTELFWRLITGDLIWYILAYLAGLIPFLFWYAILHRAFRWWIWLPVCILAGLIGVILVHNLWEWAHTPLAPPLHIHTQYLEG